VGNPSQSYGASPVIWDHTVLPASATWLRWTCPALTSARQTGQLYAEMMVCLSKDSHPSRY